MERKRHLCLTVLWKCHVSFCRNRSALYKFAFSSTVRNKCKKFIIQLLCNNVNSFGLPSLPLCLWLLVVIPNPNPQPVPDVIFVFTLKKGQQPLLLIWEGALWQTVSLVLIVYLWDRDFREGEVVCFGNTGRGWERGRGGGGSAVVMLVSNWGREEAMGWVERRN